MSPVRNSVTDDDRVFLDIHPSNHARMLKFGIFGYSSGIKFEDKL